MPECGPCIVWCGRPIWFSHAGYRGHAAGFQEVPAVHANASTVWPPIRHFCRTDIPKMTNQQFSSGDTGRIAVKKLPAGDPGMYTACLIRDIPRTVKQPQAAPRTADGPSAGSILCNQGQ